MVNEKQTKRERNIRSKLMAAVAMLLVSSIMMVSTTYAWFTLSTAPEVTGITTAVGANGNLEMALVPAIKDTTAGENIYYTDVTEALAAIRTGSSDSMSASGQTKQGANITWGNLVDLSVQKVGTDTLTYGMEDIVLYPSALNLGQNETQLTAGSLLEIPEYGSDGRVSGLAGIGSTGTYVGDGFYEDTGFGVRAIGKPSGMTARQLAWTSAKTSADSAANRVAGAAGNSLDKGGNALASMAMKYNLADNKNTVTFTDDELTKVADAYAALLASNGSVGYLKTAMRQYMIAAVVGVATDAEYEAAMNTLENADMDDLQTAATEAGLNDLANVIGELIALESKIINAKTEIENLIAADEDANWDAVYPCLKILGDPNQMELMGTTISDIVKDLETYVPILVQNFNNLKLVIKGESIYVDIADFCGKVSAGVVIEGLKWGTLDPGPVPAQMEANGTIDPPHLDKVRAVVNGIGFVDGNEGNSNTKKPISNFYGYIIDMAFRTNASDSYLRLQTEESDRIYQGNTANPETMGGGSTMSFSYESGTATNGDTVKKMMRSIRVVFFDPADLTVKQFARLDVDSAEETEETTTVDGVSVTTRTVTAKLFLCEQGGDWLTDVDGTNQLENVDLISLPQNTAVALSAMVYLDGETITNASVSTENIVGKMNLQFSSSATLTPMEYSDLREGSGTSAETPEQGGEAQEPDVQG